MAYGFKATNDSGEVIISSDQQNLHFIGKATKTADDGGQFRQETGSNQSDRFPGFTGGNAAGALDGRVLITYTKITSGRPVAFIKPDVAAYDRIYAVISQLQDAVTNEWTFQVLMSGITLDNFPELFIFIDAENIPQAVFDNDNYGMVVYRTEFTSEEICTRSGGHWGELDSRGDTTCYASASTSDTTPHIVKTFDSRAQPLTIIGSNLSRPRKFAPNDGRPLDGAVYSLFQACNYNDLDHDFHSNGAQTVGNCGGGTDPITGLTLFNCTDENDGLGFNVDAFTQIVSSSGYSSVPLDTGNTDESTGGTAHTSMMFACAAPYQAMYARQAHGTNNSGCDSTAAWWVMYKGAYRLQADDATSVDFEAGWGTYAAGYNFYDSNGVIDWNGDLGSGDGRTGWISGLMPFGSGVNINYDDSSTVIVADSRKYTEDHLDP